MMNRKIRNSLAAVLLGAALLTAPGVAAAKEAAPAIGMPNPIVEYSSYKELSRVVGFHPLFFPACAMQQGGFQVTGYSAISGTLGQIFFKGKGGQELLVRTQKINPAHPETDISGVYTSKWKPVNLGGTIVTVAKAEKGVLAAHWTVGDYAFSLEGQHMKEKEFMNLLELSFLDVSEHFYGGPDDTVAARPAAPAPAPAAGTR